MASVGEAPAGNKRRSLLPAPKASLPKSSKSSEGSDSSPPSKSPKRQLKVGDTVSISGVKCGTLRYFGKVLFAEGEWCGIELEDRDGKHDGVVESVRYFTCEEGYGIFAPTGKVDYVEGPVKNSDENGNGHQGDKSQLKQTKFKSKLSKPKAIVKPLSKETHVDSDTESTSGSLSCVPTAGGIPKPSKLPTGIAKPSKLPLQSELKQDKSKSKLLKPKSSSKKGDNSKNVTFSLDEETTETKEETFDYDIPEVTTPSRVDSVSALTLAYDLESSGSDTENRVQKKQVGLSDTYTKEDFEEEKSEASNQTFNARESALDFSSKSADGTLTSPIPDLLTPSSFHGIPKPNDDAGEAMSESETEDDLEFIGESTSQASSLGLLADSQLASNSLLHSGLKQKLGRQQSKDSVEISERDLDNEIAGVATPEVQSEVEMSSSTISCDSVQPNLDPDTIRKEHDLTFDPLPGNTSTPASPAKGIFARKMANPCADVSQPKDPVMNMTFALTGTTREDTFTVEGSEAGSVESNGRSKGVSNEYPEDILKADEDEVDGTKMAASIELAKTAVTQYADLVQSAEMERAHKVTREAEKAAKKARLEELRAKRKSVEMDVDMPSEDPTEIVLVELRKGYTGVQRPLSTCSVDTGICMDSSVTSIDSDGRRERPLSMVSSVSTDAGYHQETDCDIGTLSERDEDINSSFSSQESSSQNTDNSVVGNEENGNEKSEHGSSDGDEQVTIREANSSEVSSAGSPAGGSNEDRLEDNNNTTDVTVETSTSLSQEIVDNSQPSHTDESRASRKEISLEVGLNVTFDKAECEDTKESLSPVESARVDDTTSAVQASNLDENQDETLVDLSANNVTIDSEITDSDVHNTSMESVPIVELEVIDESGDKEPSEKENTDEKSGVNDKKAKIKNGKMTSVTEEKKNTVKVVKKTENNKITSKINNKQVPKVGVNKNNDNRVNSGKVGSKIADYIKKPNIKDENIDNKKLSKNVVNKRKASMPDVKRNSITVMPVSVTVKDRRLSMPASKLELGTGSKKIIPKSTIPENGDNGKKPIKRSPPKSKWDNIMSNINNGKDVPKTKPKTEVKSRLNVTNPPAKTNTTKPSVTTLRTPRSTTTSTETRKPSPSPATRNGKASSDSGRLSSRASSTDRSTTASKPAAKTTAKPGNKTTETLKKSRDRSTSVDSQSSVETSISQVSSQGSKSKTTHTSTPEPPPKASLAAKRKSMIESRTVTKPLSAAELRRASVAGTAASRAAAAKKTPTTGPAAIAKKAVNQNRNKTAVKSGAKPVAGKKTNQPDVVSNSLNKATAAAEISRLEALCETRTKELNYTRLQLKAGLGAFDGMAVLVRYLTEQLDAFSCPQAKADLEEVKQQLAKGQAQIAELQEEKNNLEEEVANLKKQHEEAVEKLEEEKQEELNSLQETLSKEKDEEFNEIYEKHGKELYTLKAFNERNLKDLKQEHETILEEKDEEHRGEIQQHQKDHEKRVTELKQHHDSKLADMTMTFERIKLALSEKLEMMRVECEEMKRREKQYMEQCQRDAEIKIQLALEPYKNITAEIESVKMVLEMRNEDIHKLRTEKNELIKQLEELPKAKEQITGLERKVENLDAIINIKSDYEKQLSEKHSVLMRKYDRESKANKRLSMETEELTWRLSMGDYGQGFQRQVSHSPTNSSATTPEPTRKSRPAPISPRCSGEFRGPRTSGDFASSPRSSLDLDRSPRSPRSPKSPNGKMSPRSPTSKIMNDPPKEVPPFTKILRSPDAPLPAKNIGEDEMSSSSNGEEPKSNLKRSGTYDLLDQRWRSSDDEDSCSKNSHEEDSLQEDLPK